MGKSFKKLFGYHKFNELKIYIICCNFYYYIYVFKLKI